MTLGCCGSLVRSLLFLVNLLFFILGFVVFVTAAVLKWGNTFYSEFNDIKFVNDLIETGKIGNVATALLVLAGIIMTLSMFGLCGTNCLSKPFLILYEFVVLTLFLVHGVIMLVFLFGSSSIESGYRQSLNETMNHINNNETFSQYCDAMKGVSTLFHCCGVNSPDDFVNATIASECCSTDDLTGLIYRDGCADKSVEKFKANALNLLVLPSGVILTIELFAILMVPFLIGRIESLDLSYDSI